MNITHRDMGTLRDAYLEKVQGGRGKEGVGVYGLRVSGTPGFKALLQAL